MVKASLCSPIYHGESAKSLAGEREDLPASQVQSESAEAPPAWGKAAHSVPASGGESCAQRPASGIGPLGSAPSRPRPHSALPTLNQGGAPGDIGVPCCGERGTGWACGWWRSHSWSPCRLGATGVPAWCPNTHSSPTPACAPPKRLGGPGRQVEFHGQCPETRGAWPRALQKPTGGRHRAAAPWKGPRRLAQLPALKGTYPISVSAAPLTPQPGAGLCCSSAPQASGSEATPLASTLRPLTTPTRHWAAPTASKRKCSFWVPGPLSERH